MYTTGVPRASKPRVRLTTQETTAYPAFFARADSGSTGRVEGPIAVEFFRRSGLPLEVLKEVWALAAAGERFLDRERFFVAMRLIALAQQGYSVTNESLQSAQDVALPQLDQGAAPPVPQAPPVPDKFSLTPADRQRFEQLFATQTQGKAALGKTEARPLFDKAGVSPSEMTRVWSLADPQDTGVLSKNQFLVAMQLLVKAKNGMRLPDSLPASLSALVAGQVRATPPPQAAVQPTAPRQVPEPARRSEESPQSFHSPARVESSQDSPLLQELLQVVRGLEGRFDFLSTELRSTKAEIATLRDTQSLQMETSTRDMKRHFDQTQTLLETLPKMESIRLNAKAGEGSSALVQGIAEELEDVKGLLHGLQGKWSDLQSNLGQIQANLGNVQGEMKGMRGSVASLQSDFGLVQGDLQGVRADSEDTKKAFSFLKAQMQDLTTGNQSLTKAFSTVETTLKGLKGDLSGVHSATGASEMQGDWSQLSEVMESSRQEGKETAGLVRELGENIRQLADDFAAFKANSESHPSARFEDFEEASNRPKDDLMAVIGPKTQLREEAKEPGPSRAAKSPFDFPQYQEKQPDFLEDFGLGPAQDNPNPKEDIGFESGETDPNPKGQFDFRTPANPKSRDFMFDEMMQGGRQSPSHEDFPSSAPQNSGFGFDSLQEPPKKSNFDPFEDEKPKDDYQFEEQSPENKDFF